MPPTFLWPAEGGWPYPDAESEVEDLSAGPDDDLLCLKARSPHLFEDLDPFELEVLTRHYGLDGRSPRSMKQLHADLGRSRAELRQALGSALEKLRSHLHA